MKTNQQMPDALERLLAHAIKPNADKLAPILLDQDVAVVFFEVGEGSRRGRRLAQDAARALGWNGKRVEVQRLDQMRAREVADQLPVNDPAAAAWFRRRAEGRILVVMHQGTLCVNYAPGWGYSIEPGTLDCEAMA